MHQITMMMQSVMQSQIFCNVKSIGPLGSTVVNRDNECNGIPVQLFKTLRIMLLKCCTKYISKSGRPSSGHRTGKDETLILVPRKGSTKECSNHQIIALTSHARKVMLKILHASLLHYVNQELPDVQVGFRKGSQHLMDHKESKGTPKKQLPLFH